MRIDQLLHGYSDGHRLLGSSVELPRNAKHQILMLSDMSGRSMISGFEEYLTAYPVSGCPFYAFAKTWYAPEMKRPGCVWTHTLLINESDIASLVDLSSLQSLFTRPDGSANFERYTNNLEQQADLLHSPSFEGFGHLIGPLISALYSSPEAPVFLIASDSHHFEDLIIAIWNQQWASLRKSFSFCTGAIANRSVSGRPLDMQLIPQAAAREIRRELANAVFLEEDELPISSGSHDDQWALEAAADIRGPRNPALRKFLMRFGGRRGFDGRSAFVPLLELKLCMDDIGAGGGSLQVLVEKLAEKFPSPTQADVLKRTLLKPGSGVLAGVLPGTSELDVLTELSTTPHYAAFCMKDLDIEGRATRLWHQDRRHAQELAKALLITNHNPVAEQVLSSFVHATDPKEMPELFAEAPALVITAVQANPNLAAQPGFWTGQINRQRELFDAATSNQAAEQVDLDGLIRAMLEVNSEAAVEQIDRRFKGAAVRPLLDWRDVHENRASSVLTAGWLRYLSKNQDSVLDWLLSSPTVRPSTAAFVSQILDPHSAEVRRADLAVWLGAAERLSELPEREQTRFSAFCLALAFDWSVPRSSSLAVKAFEFVHEAAAKQHLDYQAWSLLEDRVPSLSFWRNWDKCERLRRGLIERFDQNDWPPADFVLCARRASTLKLLLQTCHSFWPAGDRLLSRLRQERETLQVSIAPELRPLLSKHL